MTKTPLILCLDQGTTSSRALVFDQTGQIVSLAQEEFTQHFPKSGWVEHDAEDIWDTTVRTAREAMRQAENNGKAEIACIGITNQRETTLLWDIETGNVVDRAIVWQDRRTADLCNQLKAKGLETEISRRTGLTIDPYFSGTKIAWILRNSEQAQRLASEGRLAFGTVDSFLISRLTGGEQHVTDETNASRTLLYNIQDCCWDADIPEWLEISSVKLPDVKPSSARFGDTSAEIFGRSIPIMGVAGDQQAAAFGQACWHPGMVKSTYGTGCFLLANTGAELVRSNNRLLSTLACRTGSDAQYAIEGSIFIAGAVSQWLRDELQIIESASETEAFAEGLDSNHGIYMVPAFTGLGAPHWDAEARGAIYGLTRSTSRAELVRAALESVAYQTLDLSDALKADGVQLNRLRVDGGMVGNNWFVQFLSDILNVPVDRPEIIESTARGVAFLAGLNAGIFENTDRLEELWSAERSFTPDIKDSSREIYVSGWNKAVKTTLFRASLDRHE
ncbi:glycerol kinase GlpK [Henriciella sp. AS95]|uniref:glycerol kinase GlpK n=1 Tax=Henriciella sp. AS95 TaxID=3135782 RepID=UPI00316EF750